MTDTMQQIRFADGTVVARLGQGTWHLGEVPSRKAEELAAIRSGIEAGLRLIDTAEMYGDGATERFLGEAMAGVRDDVFLVSKAYPQNADRTRLPQACETASAVSGRIASTCTCSIGAVASRSRKRSMP